MTRWSRNVNKLDRAIEIMPEQFKKDDLTYFVRELCERLPEELNKADLNALENLITRVENSKGPDEAYNLTHEIYSHLSENVRTNTGYVLGLCRRIDPTTLFILNNVRNQTASYLKVISSLEQKFPNLKERRLSYIEQETEKITVDPDHQAYCW